MKKCPECNNEILSDIDGRFCSYCPWEEYDDDDDYIDEPYYDYEDDDLGEDLLDE